MRALLKSAVPSPDAAGLARSIARRSNCAAGWNCARRLFTAKIGIRCGMFRDRKLFFSDFKRGGNHGSSGMRLSDLIARVMAQRRVLAWFGVAALAAACLGI